MPLPKLPPPRNVLGALPPPKKKEFLIHFQKDLIEGLQEDKKSIYTQKILAPIYEPNGSKPHIFELVDQSKTKMLIVKIKESEVSEEEKKFLIKAAERHNIFNYKKIANYYAHASKDMQELMEQSALVIIDFEDAIKNGYVDFNEEIKELYARETKPE